MSVWWFLAAMCIGAGITYGFMWLAIRGFLGGVFTKKKEDES